MERAGRSFWNLFSTDLVPLQSKFFHAKFFFCILEKGILVGKKFTLQRRLFDFQLGLPGRYYYFPKTLQ